MVEGGRGEEGKREGRLKVGVCFQGREGGRENKEMKGKGEKEKEGSEGKWRV